jgi:hypothetical protein
MWFRRFTKYVTKYETKSVANHSTEQDTQHIAYLISKQVVPYRTRGGTCCPGGPTPKIQSIEDSSTTCHDGINHLHHSNRCSNHSIDPHMVILHLDRWKTTTLSQRHKPNSISQRMERLVWLFMTAWLSITNQVWTHIPKVWDLGNNIKACMPICELKRKKSHRINMVKGHMPCSPTSYCSKSWTSSSWRFSKLSAPNDSDWKQAIINK